MQRCTQANSTTGPAQSFIKHRNQNKTLENKNVLVESHFTVKILGNDNIIKLMIEVEIAGLLKSTNNHPFTIPVQKLAPNVAMATDIPILFHLSSLDFCILNRICLKISSHHRTCQKSKKGAYGFRIQFAVKKTKKNSEQTSTHTQNLNVDLNCIIGIKAE